MTKLNSADALYLGGSTVDAAYVGATQVWPSLFDPADYGTVGGWWRADSIAVSEGGSVTEWMDDSGNGRSFVVQNQAPTWHSSVLNGHAVVRCDNAQTPTYQALRADWGSQPSDPWSIFTVARATSTSPAGRIISGVYPDRRNWLSGWWNGRQGVFYHEGFVCDTEAMTTDWKLYSEASDGATICVALDHGGVLGFNGSAAGPNGALCVSGYSLGGDSETINCEVAEVIFYDSQVVTDAHFAVLDYLIAKYDL